MSATPVTSGARRFVAVVAATTAALVLTVAVVSFVRVRQLDSEAARLGVLWIEDQDNQELAAESNEYYLAARRIEDLLPLDPIALGGTGLLLAAGAIAAWPSRRADRGDTGSQDAPS